MKYLDYDHSLVSITNSVLHAFGAQPKHKTLPLLDAYLAKQYQNVVLMLFDGMGMDALRHHLPKNSFLRRHLADTVSSVFPPTTTAALTSIETGLTPYEHGWLGWSMYFPEIDQIVELFWNTIKDSGRIQAAEYNVARTLIPYAHIGKDIQRTGHGKMITISPYDGIRVTTREALFDTVRDNCAEPGRKFIYAYWNQPDAVMHNTGCRSEQTRDTIRQLDRSVQELSGQLSDTLLIVIADHGHIDTRYHFISDSPDILNMLKRPVSIESRAAAFYVKDEYIKDFPKAFHRAYGKDFMLLPRDEVLSGGLFGSGTQHPRFVSAIGDFLAVAVSDAAIVYSHESTQMVSNHAGLTQAEMRVPLILIEKPAV